MLLLLIRHAQAAEQDPVQWPDDADRPLVPRGRRVHARMARRLGRAGYLPARILSSPWKRAWQTARITTRELGLPKRTRVRTEALALPPDLPAISAALADMAPDDTVALVGHEPWMSGLAALLLAGSRDRLAVDFPKSGIMGIALDRVEAGAGVLQFFWRP